MHYSVALVVDSKFGERLCNLSERLHTWIVDSSENCPIAESIWAAKTPGEPYSIESGVTTFEPHGSTPEEWCIGIVDAIEDHHNSYAHNPGYTVLEVYGVRQSKRIVDSFKELGFVKFTDTAEGFIAEKTTP